MMRLFPGLGRALHELAKLARLGQAPIRFNESYGAGFGGAKAWACLWHESRSVGITPLRAVSSADALRRT